MRSLTLISEKAAVLGQRATDSVELSTTTGSLKSRPAYHGVGIALDSDSNHVYAAVYSAHGSPVSIYRISDKPDAKFTVATIDIGADAGGDAAALTLPGAIIAGMQYLVDSQSLCIAFQSGDILLVRFVDSYGSSSIVPTVECVGIVDSGIKTMSWSPDLELVLFVTGVDTILEMTKEFEPISEVPLHANHHGEATPVSVGWGKKETQFHGKEGKAAAVKSTAPDTDAIHLSQDDTHAPALSWRGDGNFFACSSLNPTKTARTICIYNREGILQNTSEHVSHLEHPLCWRPSGNLIASTQRLPHRHDVVFFEKNGLRHGEFALRDANDIVLDLQWNADSTVLAICLEQVVDGYPTSVIQLWTTSNYHWYLKQEIRPTSKSDSYISMLWDDEVSTRLHLISADGEYRRFQFVAETFTSTSVSSENGSVVAVIDGANVLLTPFRFNNVPPPMCHGKIVLPSPAKFIAFSPETPINCMAVLLAANTIQFWSDIHKKAEDINLIGTLSLPNDAYYFRQFAWVKINTIVVLAYDTANHIDRVIAYTFDRSCVDFTISDVVEIDLCKDHLDILRLYHCISTGVLAIQSLSGEVIEVVNTGTQWHAVSRLIFPSVCPWMASLQLGATPETKELVWIGLSERNKLFVGDRTLSLDCTSFFVHDEFLIISTLTHTVRFLELGLSLNEFHFGEQTPGATFDELNRRVERGSQIVLAVPSDTKLVMQMPRGNLEIVFPRALVLSAVRHSIDRLDYKTAFVACRKHRIDMNLIVDHSPEAFWLHISDFVIHINDADHLNLFISNMRNEDVTRVMYSTKKDIGGSDVSDKVNMVCDRMEKALDSIDSDKFIQPILTSNACKKPPNLEGAMRRIYNLKASRSIEAAESALKYLIFLVDVDQLFDVALGMYDFALVLMVAQHSQKDPREYLPFLSTLQKMPMYLQRFNIDDHLARHVSAVHNLSKAGDEHIEQLIRYIKQHELYKIGITLYPDNSKHHKTMLLEFARFHSNNSQYDEAGMLFEMAGEHSDALEAYTAAGLWKEAYTVAVEMGITQPDLENMAESLIEILTEQHDLLAVSRICIDILSDPTRAVSALVMGHHWKDSVLVATVHRLLSLKDKVIHPALLKATNQVLDETKEMIITFDKQRSRLAQVREEKLRKQAAIDAGGVPDDRLDDIDMFSDTSSMATTRITGSVTNSRASMMSSRTGRTSKQRRKMARRRAAGKEPGFEDEFLISSLATMVERSRTLATDIGAMLRALVSFGEVSNARELQIQFKILVDTIRTGYNDVFAAPVVATEPNDDAAAATGNLAVVQENHTESNRSPPPPAAIIEKPAMVTDKWWLDSFSLELTTK
ncbi:hypothetical protein BASA50_001109 [Batrachochytrium salamandrivorans]|uniref:Elongator complex protein 1 n=1 Tax=Batrachochytrium salamandrivorans TaxID=1357716 RepID=A0ABQ8ERV6_9FUNG|nr:hypothetical protein BASA50_001109 [Batrachochytrium salamandrivorans]